MAARRRGRPLNQPKALISLSDFVDIQNKHSAGNLSVVCGHCSAFRYQKERPGLCCQGGKIVLPRHNAIPEPLNNLLTSNSDLAKEFRKNIRKYNQALAFTSFGANVNQELANDRDGVYTFRVNGQICHLMGIVSQDSIMYRFFVTCCWRTTKICRNIYDG